MPEHVTGAVQERGQVFAHPARVLGLPVSDAQRLIELVRDQHAFDPDVLREHTPFFWPAEISSNRLDSYFTRMAPSSLRNYAAEAAAGIAFQNSHNWAQLGFGRSLTGRYEELDGLGRVQAEFYTFPGLRLHDVSTDDFILGVRTGLIKDVSIGFYGGSFRCSICERDMLSRDCPHIPGIRYPASAARSSNAPADELAFAWVDDAHLSEVSAVYDGATPGAAILKARQEADSGRLRPEVARVLEARYRIKLAGAARQWPGTTGLRNAPEEESTMTGEDEVTGGTPENGSTPETELPEDAVAEPAVQPPADEAIAELRALYDSQQAGRRAVCELLGVAEGGDLLSAVRALQTEHGRLQEAAQRATDLQGLLTAAETRVAELTPLAEDGRQYRADLLAETLAEGVRAYGERFSADTYRALLEAAPLATVKRMRDDWRAVGDQLFAGGRLTLDKAAPVERKVDATPNAAFVV